MQPDGEEDEKDIRFSRKSPFTPTKRLCPRCLTPLQTGSKLGGWLVPQDYYCSNCGYRGTVYIEKEVGEPGTEPEH